jgi:hypothetical protein
MDFRQKFNGYPRLFVSALLAFSCGDEALLSLSKPDPTRKNVLCLFADLAGVGEISAGTLV